MVDQADNGLPGGMTRRLEEVIRQSGLLTGDHCVVYLTAEWVAPVDTLVLPYIKLELNKDEQLLVVQRDGYSVAESMEAARISCNANEFRELCRDLSIQQLPMYLRLTTSTVTTADADADCADNPTSIGQLIQCMRNTPSVGLPLPSELVPLEKDSPALIHLRKKSTELFERGDLIGGAMGFTRALLRCPTCPTSNFNMSVILQMMDEIYFAVDYMLRVVSEDDQDAVAHTVLRTVLHPAEPDLVTRGYEAILATNDDHFRAAHSLATLRGQATSAAPAYVRQVFDHLAETFEEKLVMHLDYRVPWQIVEALQRASALPSSAESSTLEERLPYSVVDLGCGTGLCGRLLMPFVSHIAGNDLSPVMIEKTRETGFYDELEAAEIIPFLASKLDGTTDLVVSADVWIYVGALDEIFSIVAQKLRRDGWFAFSTELLREDDSFQLASSGRFKHSDAYISTLATKHGFHIRIHDEITVRKESGEPIPGRIFVLQLS